MNMNVSFRHMIENREGRHILFWICWVVGFTFIKSFGKPCEVYFGWFSYYVITLPIFVAHTYLVAYVLIPYLFSKRMVPVFIILFLGLLYGFSVLELILSNEFIYGWFPTGSRIMEGYLSPANVLRSGLGNLYIVLVFLAARTVRRWSVASNEQKELMQVELKGQMEETMTRIQPLMLLYAIDHIDRMVERSDPGVTRAIALTSELLSEVMMYHEEGQRWISREIELVKKLVSLAELFRGNRLDVEFFISGDPGTIELPPMILFSFIDLLFRRFDPYDQFPELNIEASGFSNMITIQVLQEESGGQGENLDECMIAIKQLESIYAGKVNIIYNRHSYGCSVIIRSSGQLSGNGACTIPDDVGRAKPAGA
jgi:two-component system LytT family sensor kinase